MKCTGLELALDATIETQDNWGEVVKPYHFSYFTKYKWRMWIANCDLLTLSNLQRQSHDMGTGAHIEVYSCGTQLADTPL